MLRLIGCGARAEDALDDDDGNGGDQWQNRKNRFDFATISLIRYIGDMGVETSIVCRGAKESHDTIEDGHPNANPQGGILQAISRFHVVTGNQAEKEYADAPDGIAASDEIFS